MRLRSVSFFVLAIISSLALAQITRGDMIGLSTAQSQFNSGFDNQGFWAADGTGQVSNVGSADTYGVGQTGSSVIRNFFTFDLASLTASQNIIGAELSIRRYTQSGQNESTETIEFFDVSTSAAVLNNKIGTSTTIFDDLGTGTSYGTFDVPGARPSVQFDVYTLNSAAIADLNNAKGGFFSLGGSLISNDGADTIYPIGSANLVPATLNIEFTSVPEPSTFPLASMALAIGACARRRKRCNGNSETGKQ